LKYGLKTQVQSLINSANIMKNIISEGMVNINGKTKEVIDIIKLINLHYTNVD